MVTGFPILVCVRGFAFEGSGIDFESRIWRWNQQGRIRSSRAPEQRFAPPGSRREGPTDNWRTAAGSKDSRTETDLCKACQPLLGIFGGIYARRLS